MQPLHAGLELKRDWKATRSPDYRAAIRRIQGHGITVNGCFVLGLDNQGPDCFAAVEDFVRSSGLAEVQITLLTPFPGTPLYRQLERQGRLTHPAEWDRCTLFDGCFVPARMSEADLRGGFRHLMKNLYSHQATAARKRAFHQQWRGVSVA
jgi:radical SAM superfamily enzyme YgiQ (UPF0313 family)